MCIFARHDVTRDPPFTRLDLVSCRNVLIYFGRALQDRLIRMFHYALQPSGFLVLGGSESVGQYSDLFGPVDKKNRIFAKRPTGGTTPLAFGDMARPGLTWSPRPVVPRDWESAPPFDAAREADRMVATAYAPASVVVRGDLRIVHFRGETARYLAHGTGGASLDAVQMAREGLKGPLQAAVAEARERGHGVRRRGVRVRAPEGRLSVDLQVMPFVSPEGEEYYLVSFEEAEAPAALSAEADEEAGAPSDELGQLRQELDSTREHMHTLVVDRERANEELRAAYEELQSSNEELQSINEELETAKEELQSTNEELMTVNEELQRRNDELTQTHDDLTNLLMSANIPILMLDSELRIRRFTPGIEEVASIMPQDIGRPIGHIRLRVALPDLEELVMRSIEELTTQEHEIKAENGRWYSLRIRPYKTGDQRIQGAVLSFVDIDTATRNLALMRETATLNEARSVVGVALSSSSTMEELLHQTMAAGESIGADSAFFAAPAGGGWQIAQVQALPKDMTHAIVDGEDLPFPSDRAGVVEWPRSGSARRPRFLGDLPVISSLILPLAVAGEPAGLLVFNRHSPGDFTAGQVDFGEKMVEIVSLAMDNLRLRQAEHQMADALRLRLRPSLIDIPGFVVGCAYRMAAQIEQVGGDFADIFPLEGGLVGILVGDATGKGVPATSEVETLRGMIRALTTYRPSPAFVLTEVDKILVEQHAGPMAAIFLAILDPTTGAIRYANSGHPEAVFCGEECSSDEIPHTPPLGAMPNVDRPEFERVLGPGEDLVVYTDGVTEARNAEGLFGETRLLQLLEARRGEDPQVIADALVGAAIEFGGELRDDLVVLVLRRK